MDPNRFWCATGSALGPLLFILNTSEMYELVVSRLYAYANDSTLLAVVCFFSSVFASQQTDLLLLPPLTRTWLGFRSCAITHWCMILNPNKTQSLVVSRSGTASPPHGDLVLSGLSICVIPNLDILGVKFDSRITFGNQVRGFSPMSLKELVF